MLWAGSSTEKCKCFLVNFFFSFMFDLIWNTLSSMYLAKGNEKKNVDILRIFTKDIVRVLDYTVGTLPNETLKQYCSLFPFLTLSNVIKQTLSDGLFIWHRTLIPITCAGEGAFQ
jgi:hypothetical protein